VHAVRAMSTMRGMVRRHRRGSHRLMLSMNHLPLLVMIVLCVGVSFIGVLHWTLLDPDRGLRQ
jgi:hypothetical protein